jgi:hypothetical protein
LFDTTIFAPERDRRTCGFASELRGARSIRGVSSPLTAGG